MSKTVVGLFNSTSAAQQVKQALVSEGFEASDIKIVANDHDDNFSGSTALNSDREQTSGTGIGHKISEFFQSLTGGDEHAHSHYASGVNEGGALLTVKTDDEEASEVAGLLKQHGAREIQGGYGESTGSGSSAYGSSQTSGAVNQTRGSDLTGTANQRGASNLSGETAIPVVEEELVVGKREVDRGGVRIYSHVVERPAEADVTLRDERVNVERRAVNRPATAADFEAGSSFELRATGEEAVVGKNSRVVEEVLVGKEANERTEAIHDTVRKTEVEVEQIPGNLTEKTEKSRY